MAKWSSSFAPTRATASASRRPPINCVMRFVRADAHATASRCRRSSSAVIRPPEADAPPADEEEEAVVAIGRAPPEGSAKAGEKEG